MAHFALHLPAEETSRFPSFAYLEMKLRNPGLSNDWLVAGARQVSGRTPTRMETRWGDFWVRRIGLAQLQIANLLYKRDRWDDCAKNTQMDQVIAKYMPDKPDVGRENEII